MIRYTCDMCGREIKPHTLRYKVNIDVIAAYDTLVITKEDLKRDFQKEIKRLLERMKDMDEEELMEDIWKNFSFDLCKKCRDIYLKSPLGLVTTEEL